MAFLDPIFHLCRDCNRFPTFMTLHGEGRFFPLPMFCDRVLPGRFAFVKWIFDAQGIFCVSKGRDAFVSVWQAGTILLSPPQKDLSGSRK